MSTRNEIEPLLSGARNCIRFGNVKKGEQVLLFAETGIDNVILEALSVAAKEAGANVSVLIQDPIELWYKIGKKCQRIIRENPVVRITDNKGTDLTMSVVGGGIGAYIGSIPREPGPATPGYIGTFPPGTTVWGDLNYTANGVVYLDGLYTHTRLNPPMKWTIENGFVTKIEGGPEVDEINGLIKGIKNANRLAEVGFGMNPKITVNLDAASPATRISNLLSCSRRAGALFMGIGGNSLLGGRDQSDFVSIYGILYEPTVTAGNLTIADQGKLLVLEDDDIREAAREFGDPDEVLSYPPLDE
ncbi:MAG: hypothetical protein RO469_16750 [Thermincola sp.]|jgi:2,5-dihydroxypyridine 5,6-dioxygenase|nr:hypothetical protein [Thermincola sp.]MDT3702817.1 hypothetical protein [Thermincola sp.]